MNKRRIPPETSYQLEVTELVKLFKGIIRHLDHKYFFQFRIHLSKGLYEWARSLKFHPSPGN